MRVHPTEWGSGREQEQQQKNTNKRRAAPRTRKKKHETPPSPPQDATIKTTTIKKTKVTNNNNTVCTCRDVVVGYFRGPSVPTRVGPPLFPQRFAHVTHKRRRRVVVVVGLFSTSFSARHIAVLVAHPILDQRQICFQHDFATNEFRVAPIKNPLGGPSDAVLGVHRVPFGRDPCLCDQTSSCH